MSEDQMFLQAILEISFMCWLYGDRQYWIINGSKGSEFVQMREGAD